jgi:hypothetical protein
MNRFCGSTAQRFSRHKAVASRFTASAQDSLSAAPDTSSQEGWPKKALHRAHAPDMVIRI